MKKYISPGSWFSFEYPRAWSEFADEEGSFLFYDPEHWTGNFRISASRDASPTFARETMREEMRTYPGTELLTVAGREYTHNMETFQEDGRWYVSHFWVTGEGNMVVSCTFTVAKGEPVDVALEILSTLRLMDPDRPACRELIPVRLMEVVQINEAYDWLQNQARQHLKKDFSVSAAESIAHLQTLVDNGKLSLKRDVRERLALLMGCLWAGEADGVAWATLVDGASERPVLCLGRLSQLTAGVPLTKAAGGWIDPVRVVADSLSGEGACDLKSLYEKLLDS